MYYVSQYLNKGQKSSFTHSYKAFAEALCVHDRNIDLLVLPHMLATNL